MWTQVNSRSSDPALDIVTASINLPSQNMKLTQRRFLMGTIEFEMDDTSVRIRQTRLMNESRFEIPIRNFGPILSYHRSAQLRWIGWSCMPV